MALTTPANSLHFNSVKHFWHLKQTTAGRENKDGVHGAAMAWLHPDLGLNLLLCEFIRLTGDSKRAAGLNPSSDEEKCGGPVKL